MKAIWKILIGTAAVAAVAPYQVKKDQETGTVTLKAATWSGTYVKNGEGGNLTLKLLPGLLKDKAADEEACCCEEDCCCESQEEPEDEGGITIEVTVDKDEPEADAPKPEEA